MYVARDPHIIDTVLALPRGRLLLCYRCRLSLGWCTGRPNLPGGEKVVADGQGRLKRKRVPGDLSVAEGVVAAGCVGRGVEIPGDNEGNRAGGKAAGLLVPRSEPAHFVQKLFGLCMMCCVCVCMCVTRRKGNEGTQGGRDVVGNWDVALSACGTVVARG